MKLSKETVSILKGLSNISEHLLIRPGNHLRVQNKNGDVIASAKVEETFTSTAGIYNLPRFMGALSLFDSPELTFGENQLAISDGKQTIHYTYAAVSMMASSAPPDEDLEFDRTVSFDLASIELSRLIKGMDVLQHAELLIRGDGTTITMEGVNVKNPTSDTYSIVVGETDRTFKFYVNRDVLKIIPGDYTISLGSSGDDFVEFKSKALSYWITITSDSDHGTL